MPAGSVTEARYTVAAGSSFVEIDIAGRGGDPPSNRYKIRITNTHATDRLYVAVGADPGASLTGEVAEANYGIWEDFVEAGVSVWARPSSTNSIYIIVKQYAVS